MKSEDGKVLKPKGKDEVHCEVHNITVIWRDLDPIQRLAVENGLDTLPDLQCLLLPR